MLDDICIFLDFLLTDTYQIIGRHPNFKSFSIEGNTILDSPTEMGGDQMAEKLLCARSKYVCASRENERRISDIIY